METIVVDHPDKFDDTILQAKSSNKNVLVLVIGERDKETGLSWCPDCVKAEPYLNDAFKRIGNCVVIECPVVKSEYKGNPDHPYRKHPNLLINCVPTLIHWTKSGPQERLLEGECYDQFKVDKFVEIFHHKDQ